MSAAAAGAWLSVHALPAALAANSRTRGASPADSSEPVVWRDMTQRELERALGETAASENASQIAARFAARSAYARTILGNPARYAYGPKEAERIALYAPSDAGVAIEGPAPVMFFVHGGAWQSGTADEHLFLAEPFLHEGFFFALADFPAVQEVGGDLQRQADSVKKAFLWLAKNAPRLGIDPEGIYVCGHCSGAHHAALLATSIWAQEGLAADVIKGAVLIGGLYELKPVRLSGRRLPKLTHAQEEALSPARRLESLNAALVVACGEFDSPEVLRQSRELFDAMRQKDKRTVALKLSCCNHLEALESLSDPDSPLARAAFSLMRNQGA